MKKFLMIMVAGLFVASAAIACPGVEGCKCDMKKGSDHSKCDIKSKKACSDCKVVDGKKVLCKACLAKKAKEGSKVD